MPSHYAAELRRQVGEQMLAGEQPMGAVFSSGRPYNIPHPLRLDDQGHLDLDAMVTRTYPLEEINQGYAGVLEVRNIRGVLVFD
jgi:Zn-dependent alcohol dehydrogenase